MERSAANELVHVRIARESTRHWIVPSWLDGMSWPELVKPLIVIAAMIGYSMIPEIKRLGLCIEAD